MRPTMKSVIRESYIPARLFRGAIRQFGTWAEFLESCQDIADYGAGTGWSGFIYYSETVPFSKRHKKDIMLLAVVQSSDFGQDIVQFFEGFRCFNDFSKDEISSCIAGVVPEDLEDIWFNCLAWYVLETVAQDTIDYIERMEEED